ncbi:MAG: glucose-6-phosphate isomerase [Pseudomonadota bacterium]
MDFQSLSMLADAVRGVDLKALAAEPGRADGFVWSAPHLEVDVVKQPLNAQAMDALLELSKAQGLDAAKDRLFAGDIVNGSENRPALHWALRGGAEHLPQAEVFRTQAAAATAFAEKARSGGLGFDLKSILHIGIGGSDLGPRLIWDALRPLGPDRGSNAVNLSFCANVDPEDFMEAAEDLDPATTLVIVVSKSFKTPETQSNAILAREWLVAHLGEGAADAHLAAVSSAPDLAKAWGAAQDRIFPMDEAVGGRYSVWSSVGLSLEIALGGDVWRRFLSGASEMDAHFKDAPLAENVPARLAMMDVWLHTFLDVPSRVVLSYAHRLRKLADFLQQLEMESNGKSIPAGDAEIAVETAPVTWGSVGTIGQHSFHQLLHQGTRRFAPEFVFALNAGGADKDRGRALLANALAQAEAMLMGRSSDEARAQLQAKGVGADTVEARAPHMHMPGGRGATMIALNDLSPESVGALIALYEHRTFAGGVLWGVNPFDQWGVERGKVLAEEIDQALSGADAGARDPSTVRLIDKVRAARG